MTEPDTIVEETETRDPSKLNIPKHAFAFRFYDILSVIVEDNDQEVKLTSATINQSPTHYYGGKVYTAEEVKRKFPNERTLINNMVRSRYDKMIHCRTGDWMPFKENDIHIEAA